MKTRSGTNNLDAAVRKKSYGIFCSRVSVRRVTHVLKALRHSLRTAKRLQARSQRDHFPQHPQAVAEKADFASFSVIPPNRNLPNPQPGAVRKKKQFNVERKAVDTCRFQNRLTNIQAEGLEPAL